MRDTLLLLWNRSLLLGDTACIFGTDWIAEWHAKNGTKANFCAILWMCDWLQRDFKRSFDDTARRQPAILQIPIMPQVYIFIHSLMHYSYSSRLGLISSGHGVLSGSLSVKWRGRARNKVRLKNIPFCAKSYPANLSKQDPIRETSQVPITFVLTKLQQTNQKQNKTKQTKQKQNRTKQTKQKQNRTKQTK